MKASFITALNTVLPFVLYLTFGYGVKRLGVVDETFLKKLNRMVFQCFFPVMMFSNVYHIETVDLIRVPYVLTALFSLLAVIVILMLVVPLFVKGNPQRGVIIQGIYRSNFVLFALPMAESVFGAEGATTASVLIAIIVPFYNLAAVIILEMFHEKELAAAAEHSADAIAPASGKKNAAVNPKILLQNVLTNPLIVGAIVGAVFLFSGISLPQAVDRPVQAIADMTTPLALFVLGGTLRFRAIGPNMKYLVPTLAAKMILLPLLTTILSTQLSMTAIERFVLLVMYGSPTAVASYAMAENMGGDGELAGQIVVIGTAVSVFTLFGWIFLYGQMGML
ncbi:MAG: AEC family transporter [Eubacterium sp.]|nr:AEC family transporter [Eubacterium sp.]